MIPFNIASYALLLELICAITGYIPGILTGFLADVHIYENHLDQVKEQLTRVPKELPKLSLSSVDDTTILWEINPDQISLVNYDPYPAILAPMAV